MPTEYFYGSAQGDRESMEDVHVVTQCDQTGFQLYTISDGHAGLSVVKQVKELVADAIFAPFRERWKHEQKEAKDSKEKRIPVLTVQDYKTMLTKAVVDFDRHLSSIVKARGRSSGCTLIAALFHPVSRQLVLINVGDSRAVYQPNTYDSKLKLVETKDHKPNDALELARVKAAGSFVQNGRVSGILAMSRAIGDFPLKKTSGGAYDPINGPVSAVPEVYVGRVHKSGGFLVLACDGIYDVLSSREVIDHARSAYTKYRTAGSGSNKVDNPAKSLVHLAYNKGSTDNMTALIVRLPGIGI
jgi:protein phosphatase 2C family protein 2/3